MVSFLLAFILCQTTAANVIDGPEVVTSPLGFFQFEAHVPDGCQCVFFIRPDGHLAQPEFAKFGKHLVGAGKPGAYVIDAALFDGTTLTQSQRRFTIGKPGPGPSPPGPRPPEPGPGPGPSPGPTPPPDTDLGFAVFCFKQAIEIPDGPRGRATDLASEFRSLGSAVEAGAYSWSLRGLKKLGNDTRAAWDRAVGDDEEAWQDADQSIQAKLKALANSKKIKTMADIATCYSEAATGFDASVGR